jgi:tol-pal system protein YbgF
VILQAPPAGAPPGTPQRRGDAFDPASDPAAPGAPRPIGAAPPSAPLNTAPRAAAPASPAPLREPGQPLDITPGRLAPDAAAPGPQAPPEIAAEPPLPGPKEDYDQAVASLRAGQYEAAEKSLTVFLAKNSKSKYAPAATLNLGESFFLRGRHREAAEKYLDVTAKYAQSAQAPEAMLRLGQSLNALGAKEQACASFAEIGLKYPGAPARIRDAASRESKKLQC